MAVQILSKGFLSSLMVAICLPFVAGCDIAPPSSPATPPTERPVGTEPQPVVQAMPSPWDLSWVPADSQAVAARIDSLVDGTGLSEHGGTILQCAQGYGVNPAFALAMSRKEAEFAKQGSIAQRQNNPGNIICGGGTTPLYGATGCGGRFGLYDTMADGIKAYFWLLDNEYKPERKYDCEDIACIIAIYCPPSDCGTAHYVEQVADWTIQYQSLLSAGGPLVLEPGPTVPSMAVTIVPATVVSESPTPTVVGGRIALESTRDGGLEVYMMNADSSGQRNLTNHPDWDGEPSWSPDGMRIAFSSTRDGNWEIYVMNADGSEQTRLTNNPAVDERPRWLPDGRHIAFRSNRDGNWKTYVMNVDASGVTPLTNNAWDSDPTWSPDGMRMAIASARDGNWEIYMMNADGSGAMNLTNNPSPDLEPSWSPDGTRIAFTSYRDGNREIYSMNADGTHQTRLTNNPAYEGRPCWSPDSTRIAFQSERDGSWQIYVMNADGTGVARLTSPPGNNDWPSWSPS